MRPLRARCTECFAPSWQKKPTEFPSSCGPAAPSWILMRTPGDQPNSLKLWTIITDPQSEYCDSKWPPVGILVDGQYRDQTFHSCSDKFGDRWYKSWRWFQQCDISASRFFTTRHREAASSTRLATRTDFCWLRISSCVIDHRLCHAFFSVSSKLIIESLCYGKIHQSSTLSPHEPSDRDSKVSQGHPWLV